MDNDSLSDSLRQKYNKRITHQIKHAANSDSLAQEPGNHIKQRVKGQKKESTNHKLTHTRIKIDCIK